MMRRGKTKTRSELRSAEGILWREGKEGLITSQWEIDFGQCSLNN
jgi:hypothetical protein